MIVSQTTIERIRSSRHRQRTLQIPVQHGPLGEMRRCPFKPGSAYTLQAASHYQQHKSTAEQQPTRARAVLHLIDSCEHPVKSVTITVTRPPERHDDHWLVYFDFGDQTAHVDRPVFMGQGTDYTFAASRAIDKAEVMTPFAKDLEAAREKATEKRDAPYRSGIAAMRAAQRRLALKRHDMKVQAARRLKLIERETEKLAAELSGTASASLCASDRAGSETPAAAQDGLPQSGARSVVSLEAA